MKFNSKLFISSAIGAILASSVCCAMEQQNNLPQKPSVVMYGGANNEQPDALIVGDSFNMLHPLDDPYFSDAVRSGRFPSVDACRRSCFEVFLSNLTSINQCSSLACWRSDRGIEECIEFSVRADGSIVIVGISNREFSSSKVIKKIIPELQARYSCICVDKDKCGNEAAFRSLGFVDDASTLVWDKVHN